MKKSIPNEILLPEVARLIKEGHTVTITVRGNSMNPFLVDRRDRVTLGDFTTEQLQPGVSFCYATDNKNSPEPFGSGLFFALSSPRHNRGQDSNILSRCC